MARQTIAFTMWASMRLYDVGLDEIDWIGIVEDDEVESTETHYVIPLKACVVEVVAAGLTVGR